MNANHLHIWMKQAREGKLVGRSNLFCETSPTAFIDLGVISPGVQDVEPGAPAAARSRCEVPATTGQVMFTGGLMEIVAANGRRVTVDRTVDVSVLMRIVQGLEEIP
ncbi:hypothetical protein EOA34_32820 [Mesorhizobium sp. M4B.F.Ca.ET.013.02.1.1]|nr:hypothetical protein EOA34_32820 [Mesorhizobium sp. M4B.F.Ca.ET.013.02.1.1]